MGVATIAGLALAAAGTGVSMANARATQRRMNEVVRSQIAAAEEYQKPASTEFQRSLGETGAEASKRALAQGQEEALGGYQDVQSMFPSTAPSPILSNEIVNTRNAARIGQANQANAALQGYGNLTLQQILANQRAQQNLGVISGLAGSQSAITPYLLQGAQNQGQDLAAVGSLLGTAGSLAGVYGSLAPYLNPPKNPNDPPAGGEG